jgi:hypothetical protein
VGVGGRGVAVRQVLTVGELRAALEKLPDDMPVALLDDLSVDPLVSAGVFWWRYSNGWGAVSDDRDRYFDGEPIDDGPVPVRAFCLAARNLG